MEPDTDKIKKPERILIHGDAEQRKARLRQYKEEQGADPAVAAAWAEEAVARTLPPDEAATDTFGEQLGEHFMRAATGADEEGEPAPPVDITGEVVIPESLDAPLDEEEILDMETNEPQPEATSREQEK